MPVFHSVTRFLTLQDADGVWAEFEPEIGEDGNRSEYGVFSSDDPVTCGRLATVGDGSVIYVSGQMPAIPVVEQEPEPPAPVEVVAEVAPVPMFVPGIPTAGQVEATVVLDHTPSPQESPVEPPVIEAPAPAEKPVVRRGRPPKPRTHQD